MRGGVGRAQSGSSLPHRRRNRAMATSAKAAQLSLLRETRPKAARCVERVQLLHFEIHRLAHELQAVRLCQLAGAGCWRVALPAQAGGPVVADRPALRGLGREVRNVETPLVEEDVRLAACLLEEGERTQPCVVKLARDIFPGNAGVSLGVTFKAGLKGVYGSPVSGLVRRSCGISQRETHCASR